MRQSGGGGAAAGASPHTDATDTVCVRLAALCTYLLLVKPRGDACLLQLGIQPRHARVVVAAELVGAPVVSEEAAGRNRRLVRVEGTHGGELHQARDAGGGGGDGMAEESAVRPLAHALLARAPRLSARGPRRLGIMEDPPWPARRRRSGGGVSFLSHGVEIDGVESDPA